MPSYLHALALVSSFTAAQSNISLLNDILWGTCNPSLEGGLDQCTQNMRWFEREMVKDDVCGKEMSEERLSCSD
ncbi:hypothetical protein VKT23_011922 [Stygiomarasmius scandens]|uniref:DUF7729 domain-containing protein n=1 Tax=Marasmiellus scandens TaxID=2682957 RepID=A0ABR1JBD0_9AGAR